MVDVLQARRRIRPYIRRTPLVASAWLSDHTSAHVSLKLETQQLSNSFKLRGAFNAVIARLERPGVAPARLVTASAGNHGRALAAAAKAFRLALVVFTPADAPRSKLDAIRRVGGEPDRGYPAERDAGDVGLPDPEQVEQPDHVAAEVGERPRTRRVGRVAMAASVAPGQNVTQNSAK